MRWTAFASWGLGILLSLACGPQKPVENDQRLLPPAAKYCAGPDCKKKSSDIAKLDLTTDKNPTNQREVLLRWTAAAEQAYVLQASRDPDCSQVFEARTTQKGETSFSQLDDGVWYFCLREANTKRVLSSDETLGVLQITVDRAAPTFQLPADLSLEGGTILDLKVRDLLDYSCEWASTATNLALEPQGPGQVKLLNIFSGSFPLSIQCRDVAGNESKQDFVVSLTEPKTPVNVGEVKAFAGSDQVWNRPNFLSAMATGAKHYSWRLVKGPGAISFQRPNDLETLVTPTLAGVYTIRFTAISPDGKTSVSDDLELTWNPTPLMLKPSFTRTSLQLFTRLQGIALAGDYAYIAREQFGLTVLNISNPASISPVTNHLIGNTSTEGWAYKLKVVGQTLFVANWGRGLTAVDIRDPLNPVVLGSLNLQNASDVVIDGAYAYVSLYDEVAQTGGLAVVQISDPRAMVLVKTLDTNGTAASLAKQGTFVYLTHSSVGTFRGLKVIDVSTPSNPRVVRNIVRNGMEEIHIAAGKAYVAAGDQGFEIFDLTNPGNPTSLSLTTPQAAGSAGLYIQGLDLAEGYLFVTDYSGSRMLAYKVSDAVRPQAMGAFLTSQGKPALWVRVQGQHVYLSSEERGLEVIEVFE